MDTFIEVHPVTRITQSSSSKKKQALPKTDLDRLENLTQIFNHVKSQLHGRLVNSVLDIVKNNEKFRRLTNRCFEHIPVMALCMDSNISEHKHLFEELDQELSDKFNSIVISLNNAEQYSTIHQILKITKNKLNKFYPNLDDENQTIYFRLSQFVQYYDKLKETEKRSMIFVIPEFESVSISIFEHLITLLSLQIKSISISFVVGLSGGDHSLQRLISNRIASKLSIDTIYDSSARKYYEHIIKALFLSENEKQTRFSITAEQLRFIEQGYFESYSLAWLEHALKFIVFSENEFVHENPLNVCLFNAIYVSSNQLANYPLGRYRSTFFEYFLSNRSISNDLSLSINSSTSHQLDHCLHSFLEHKCNENDFCKKFRQSAKNIFHENQQKNPVDSSILSSANTLRSLNDRKLNQYREQVLLWFKPICDLFSFFEKKSSTSKINENLLQERLMPMTRSIFVQELANVTHSKQQKIPDLALLYRVYSESGTKIQLSDWFESFSSSVEEQEIIDDDKQKSILARFVHGLAELDYLGFTKTSLQRSYHATRLTWDS